MKRRVPLNSARFVWGTMVLSRAAAQPGRDSPEVLRIPPATWQGRMIDRASGPALKATTLILLVLFVPAVLRAQDQPQCRPGTDVSDGALARRYAPVIRFAPD